MADAALELNIEDGGNRKFIMAQLPEPCSEESEAYKAGYKNIADIGEERIRRVIKNIGAEQAAQAAGSQGEPSEEEAAAAKSPLDLGFKVFKLQKSNFRGWDGTDPEMALAKLEEQLSLHVDHQAGYLPTVKVEQVELAGKSVYSVATGKLLICLEDEITRELIDAVAAAKPDQFICLDQGFQGNDQLKANAVQTFAALNQEQRKDGQIVFRTV